jgi:hypothetical protein
MVGNASQASDRPGDQSPCIGMSGEKETSGRELDSQRSEQRMLEERRRHECERVDYPIGDTMFTALLLAVAVAGQSADEPVAKTAKPSVGLSDRVSLGERDFKNPSGMIHSAHCYSSLENFNLFVESANDKRKSGLSIMPDCYLVRAGTGAAIKETHTVDVLTGGETIRITMVKVQILDGDFKGKMLFTPQVNTYGSIKDKVPGAPQAKMAPHKRSGRRAPPGAAPIGDAKLVLTDLTTNPTTSGSYVKVNGRVRCTSEEPLRGIVLTVLFEDKDGNLVRSVEGYCSPITLSSGDIGSIDVMAESDPRYARVKIDFNDLQRAIPWVDQSGTNAHQ